MSLSVKGKGKVENYKRQDLMLVFSSETSEKLYKIKPLNVSTSLTVLSKVFARIHENVQSIKKNT